MKHNILNVEGFTREEKRFVEIVYNIFIRVLRKKGKAGKIAGAFKLDSVRTNLCLMAKKKRVKLDFS